MTQPSQVHKLSIAIVTMVICSLFASLLILPNNANAQAARTPRSRDNNANQNRGDLQATLQAQSTQVAGTVQAGIDNAAAQVTAAAGTFDAMSNDFAATAQYVATQAAQSADSIAATVTAISAAFQNLSPELQALLTALGEQGSISHDGDSLTATLLIYEAQANELLDILVEAAGYDPDSATLNTRADGLIDVVLTDISGEFSGTLVMSYQVGVSEAGTVTYTLVAATLNGSPIPLERLPEELTSAIDLAIYATVIQPMLGTDTIYTVESVVVTEDAVLLVVRIPIEQ